MGKWDLDDTGYDDGYKDGRIDTIKKIIELINSKDFQLGWLNEPIVPTFMAFSEFLEKYINDMK